MFRIVCILNVFLVLPFAVSALVTPEVTFASFGLALGAEGVVVARGYGAAAMGWGLACALLSGSRAPEVVRGLMIASLAFNLAEVLVQVPVALSGIASAMIWGTIGAHAVLAALSAMALRPGRLRGA